MVSTGRGAEAEEEAALQIRQLGKLAKQRVFGFKSFGAPGTDVLWRAYGGAQSDEATLLWGPVATPDLGPQFCDSGRRRATFVVENSRLAQIGGYAGMCLDLTCHQIQGGTGTDGSGRRT